MLNVLRQFGRRLVEEIEAATERAAPVTGLPDAVVADLQRLDTLQPGLGRRALAYVRDDEPAGLPGELGRIWAATPFGARSWDKDSEPSRGRERFLATDDTLPVAQLNRWLRVLLAGGVTNRMRDGPASPEVRYFVIEFAIAASVVASGLPAGERDRWAGVLSPAALFARAEGLGATTTEVYRILFDPRYRFGGLDHYLRHPGFASVMDAHRAVLAADLPALPAETRDLLIARMRAQAPATVTALAPALAVLLAKARSTEAVNALAAVDPDRLAPAIRVALGEAGADGRLRLVSAAAQSGSPALAPVLAERLAGERAGAVRSGIETALATLRPANEPAFDAPGYLAVNGSFVALPPVREPDDGPIPPPPPGERARFDALIATETARRVAELAKVVTERGHSDHSRSLPKPITKEEADAFYAMMTGDTTIRHEAVWSLGIYLSARTYGPSTEGAVLDDMLARLPDAIALPVGAHIGEVWTEYLFHSWRAGRLRDRVFAYLQAGGDFRYVLNIEAVARARRNDMAGGGWPPRDGDEWLRLQLKRLYGGAGEEFRALPPAAFWPHLLENLHVIDEALGLSPTGAHKPDRDTALEMLLTLPSAPQRYYAVLLDLAVTARRPGRDHARALLRDAVGLTGRIVALLGDPRADVRAGAAGWLADLRASDACPALFARLAKEKADPVRTALIGALKRLGADLSPVIGPATLVAEAVTGLAGGKAVAPDWLDVNALPVVRFADGAVAPAELVRWWVALATKGRDPTATARFGLYLDQLDPADARAVSAWLLESWIAHDTREWTSDELNAWAIAEAKHLRQSGSWYLRTPYDEHVASLRRLKAGEMPNSAIGEKGLLALACRADPVWAAGRVRWYLKHHGRRSRQAEALLDMLAGNGSPAALQVVIAASVRLKQKSVQKHAGELVARFAADRGWTTDQLADRTVPAAGLDDDGVLALPCDGKAYTARMGPKLELMLFAPTGKPVKALPAGDDEDTTASKKALANAKKELKQIVEMQAARLREAMCFERRWAVEEWLSCFHAHPVMRRLVERLVWEGLDAGGGSAFLFRPTPEGDFTDAGDAPVALAQAAEVRLAHGAMVAGEVASAWEAHLADYEVVPLFPQFGPARGSLDESVRNETAIRDREGWVTDSTTLRGLAAKLGYERVTGDGGGCTEYEKPFGDTVAVVEHSGAHAIEETVPAALIALRFRRAADRYGGFLPLGKVPAVLVAECRADFHAMAAKAAFDPAWKQVCLW